MKGRNIINQKNMSNNNKQLKRKENSKISTYLTLFVFVFIVACSPVSGLALEVVGNPNTPVEGRFVVGPTKIELNVSPGETGQAIIEIENRTGRTGIYDFSFEDFVGGEEGGSNVVLLGGEAGVFSLRDYISVEESSVVLKHGDRIRVPVSVSIPTGAIPGGKFASFLVSSRLESDLSLNLEGQSGAKILGRVGVLFFVTVPGDVKEDGSLQSFRVAKDSKILKGGEAVFQIGFENTGTVHLNPYGVITIRNIVGQVVSRRIVDPWFVLPNSFRTRDITVSTEKYFGWYKATLELNRGYDDVVDTGEVNFVVFTPTYLFVFAVALMGVVFGWRRGIKK